MIIPNKLSILYSKHVDAVTENATPVKTNQGWVLPLNLSYSDLQKKALSELPDHLLPLINTIIVAGTFSDSTAVNEVHKNINQGRTRSRPSKALQYLGLVDLSELYSKLSSNIDMFSVLAACASGIKALQLAQRNESGLTLIISAEVASIEFINHLFNSIGATSKADTWAPPMDSNVGGIMLGDGSAAIIVSSTNFAEKHNLKTKAIIESLGYETIPTHPTNPSDIKKLEVLIENTIFESGIPKEDFSYWNAHATATPAGDSVELELHSKILPDIPITSYKSKIGHTLGASSLVELAAAIDNFDDPSKKTFLKCSFGFGGNNGILVVSVL